MGCRCKQLARVSVAGIVQDLHGFANFDDLAAAHDSDVVTHLGGHAQVVGDEHTFEPLAFYASRMLREDMQRLLGKQQFSTV